MIGRWLLSLALATPAPAAWIDVPFVRQVKEGCGAAAVAMVVQYWGRQEPRLRAAAVETERIEGMLPASPKGLRGEELRQYLEGKGFEVFVFDGEVRDLAANVEKGRPVIVCFAPGGAREPLHFAVVVGVDGGALLLNDPARGKSFREDLRRFLSQWKLTRNWALLAVPRPIP